MKLDVLTLGDCEQVRWWRNQDLSGLRTPYMLTMEEQQWFYSDIQNKNGSMRYWAIRDIAGSVTFGSGEKIEPTVLIGMGGLTDISLENRNAEISLIIDPELRGKGYGEEAVRLILEQGFCFLNLFAIYGEVYHCNVAGLKFWQTIIKKYKALNSLLHNRKYWKGEYYHSDYFTITKEMFNAKV